MSRNVRKKPKKTASKHYGMPVFVASLMIAVIGGYFVVEWIKQFSAKPESTGKNNPPATMAITETYPHEQLLFNNDFQSLPVSPEINGDITAQIIGQYPVLPNLLDSDILIRQIMGKMSPGLLPWLSADQLIRRYMLVVNDFAQSQRIANHMSFIRLDKPFLVEMIGNELFISSKCYQRYNRLVQAVQAINTKVAIMFYKQIRPLMLQVFMEFGYPEDISLEKTLKKAVAQILATPVVEGRVGLVRPSMYYKFADKKLELLNPVQKQMVRMGPENTRIIKSKLREFLVELAKTDFS